MGEKVFVASEETLQIVKGTVEDIDTNLGTPDFGAGDTDVVALLKEIKTATSVKEPYIEETYDSVGNLIDVKMHGYTKIRSSAFHDCMSLALTSLPAGVTSIGSEAFYCCKSLALTSLPAGVTSIRSEAFRDCTSLALTSLPAGVTSIGDRAFAGCTSLALTSLPAGITSIGRRAFEGCTSLTNIIFKGTPTSISSTAFEACGNLTVINVPWAEGEVAGAPWGATNATINYNYTE